MPKAFSEHEREIVQHAMLETGSTLIRKKGIRQVTVEDITKGANIAKGSFYSFYKKREKLFWDIIKREEQQLIDKIERVAADDIPVKEKIQKIFYDLFLEDNCLVFYLSQEDLQYLIRKLPPELIKADMESGQKIVKNLLKMCGLSASDENAKIMMSMIHTLQFVASNDRINDKTVRNKMLSLLVETFANYYAEVE
ncbi:MAG TPA: TetR/AcrR family transcriptional regulator [Tissierellia bacterium]|nr:TetR/AcrR family transcriptional regulator [Tissierellia bacterium]